MSRGQSQPRPQLARRALGRCRNKEDFDNGEVIDVDKIRGDVVVVDDSETSHCPTTRAKEIPSGVICIDDEEEDADGAPGNVDSSPIVEGSDSDDDCHIFVEDAGLAASAMRRRAMYPECGSSRNRYGLYSTSDDSSSESDPSELEMPESGSSYSDNSDCEILDGSSGNIREQWERAALKRKLARMGRYAAKDWVSDSGSSDDPDIPSDEPVQGIDEGQNDFNQAHSQHFQYMPDFHGGRRSCNRKETLSPGTASVDCVAGYQFESPKANVSVEASVPGTGDQFESPKANVNVEDSFPGTGDRFESPRPNVNVEDSVPGIGDRFESPRPNVNVEDSVPGTGDRFESPKANANVEESGPGTGDWFESPKANVNVEESGPGTGDRFESPKANVNVEESGPGTGDWFESPKAYVNVEESGPGTGDRFESSKANVNVEDSVPGISMCPDEPPRQHKNEASSLNGVNLPDESAFDYWGDDTADLEMPPRAAACDEGLETTRHVGNDGFSFMNLGEQLLVGPTFSTTEIQDGVRPLDNSVPCIRKTSPCVSQPCCINQVYSDVAGFEDNEEQVNLDPAGNINIPQGSNANLGGTFHGKEDSTAQAKEDSSAKERSPRSTLECVPEAGHEVGLWISTKESDVENELIVERERHKESEEFRRASEEEWASRHRELQIQAEEAQRLRKRRKAETLRLIDMERRQKQRLEEIRESQKKVEETVNLKEAYRTEVRKQLEKMEMGYKDMASLLRGLGIQVGGGRFPLPSEVNSAYKQALLRFHPDRASKTDIRKLVEAEEIFKLITRSKEKLLPVL